MGIAYSGVSGFSADVCFVGLGHATSPEMRPAKSRNHETTGSPSDINSDPEFVRISHEAQLHLVPYGLFIQRWTSPYGRCSPSLTAPG